MKIYDISRDIFSTPVYPGDTAPAFVRVREIGKGSECNLTDFSMCAHNATHVDAPCHFVDGGKTVEEIPLSACVGEAEVIFFSDTEKIKKSALKRILLKNCGGIDTELAHCLADKGVMLVGLEAQSVGDADVHRILLSRGVVLLEGINLEDVPCGKYLLSAAPIKLGGSDGAPCRALLIEY